MKIKRLMTFCWFLPLILGSITFFSWRITRFDLLMATGIYIIYFGIVCTVIGFITGLRQVMLNRKKGKSNKSIYLLFGLIASNFIIAYLYLNSAVSIVTAFTIRIFNKSNTVLYNCSINGGGINEQIETIDKRDSVKRVIWIKEEGSLTFNYKINNSNKTVNIQGYICPGVGGNEILVIQ